MQNVEKWTDRVTFVLMLTLSVCQAICANYMAMAGWFCAALWLVIAMIRRKDRDSWKKACYSWKDTYDNIVEQLERKL